MITDKDRRDFRMGMIVVPVFVTVTIIAVNIIKSILEGMPV